MINVTSETGVLRKLIVHRPDRGIETVTPGKATEWLYEDIVFLDKMQEEHDTFTRLLRHFTGEENVIDIQALLTEILQVPAVRDQVVRQVCDLEQTPEACSELLDLAPAQLAEALVTGMSPLTDTIFFPPSSNFIFCRDIAAVINDHIFLTQAAKKARARETLLARAVIRHSSVFRASKFLEISKDEELVSGYRLGDFPLSLEGGDVMVFNSDHLLIGCSERSSAKAIDRLTDLLFRQNVVSSVVRVDLPKERYCMHLDTIFTLIDDQDCVVYEPLINQASRMRVVQYHKNGGATRFHSLKEFVSSQQPAMNFISCGNGKKPFEEREQWTDGCNLFALKPGVAITYERNVHTAKALRANGYRIVDAIGLLASLDNGELTAKDIARTVILMPSHELSRARGGTHCLTMPLWRENVTAG